jgi:hypothetical protein
MMHVNTKVAPSVSSETWWLSTQARIDSQAAIVASLEPGSKGHRTATSVLFLLQDSLFVLSQTKMLLKAAREQTDAARRNGRRR